MNPHVEIEFLSWAPVESGRRHWKGMVQMNLRGRLFNHRCTHNHRSDRTAFECAKRIAKEYQ